MTTAATALHLLRRSRDAERDASIWHDDGRTVERLARDAGVRVEYVHVSLSTLTCERRTIEGGEEGRCKRQRFLT